MPGSLLPWWFAVSRTPTVTGAPDGAGAADPAAALVGEPAGADPELPGLLLLEHAAASTATAETSAPNQRRPLSEFRIISFMPFILSSWAARGGPGTRVRRLLALDRRVTVSDSDIQPFGAARWAMRSN